MFTHEKFEGIAGTFVVDCVTEVWGPTLALRWYRPPGGNDADLELQQAWQSMTTGKVEWRPLEVVMAD